MSSTFYNIFTLRPTFSFRHLNRNSRTNLRFVRTYLLQQFQLRSGSASHRRKARKLSNPSPYSRNRLYRSCDLVRFFDFAGSPTIGSPRKQPSPFHFVHCQPHEHLSFALPLPPLSHSLQAVHALPLSSVKLWHNPVVERDSSFAALIPHLSLSRYGLPALSRRMSPFTSRRFLSSWRTVSITSLAKKTSSRV